MNNFVRKKLDFNCLKVYNIFIIIIKEKINILIIYINMEKRRDDPLIGKVFFKTYKVKKMLGEGSFGKIYSAININTKEEFAVKLVCIYQL